MHWEEELKDLLLVAIKRHKDGAAEGDDEQRDVLAHVMTAAEEVFEFAVSVLDRDDMHARFEASRGFTLKVDDRFLEAMSVSNGFAIKVRRESGVVDVLRVDDGLVVDGNHKPIGLPEAYFARLVVELARTARATDGG